MVLRISSDGAYVRIPIQSYISSSPANAITLQSSLITNGDAGVILSWSKGDINLEYAPPPPSDFGMAVIAGTSVNIINAPSVPGQLMGVIPVLQRSDGSFIGKVGVGSQTNPQYDMVAFDASGSTLWSVPNEFPQIATSDGGVIGKSGTIYDQNGSAVGGSGGLPIYSWRGNDDPFARWVCRRAEVENAPAPVFDYKEAIKYTKSQCWNGKEVKRGDHFAVVVQES
jgi:hypothetical protein